MTQGLLSPMFGTGADSVQQFGTAGKQQLLGSPAQGGGMGPFPSSQFGIGMNEGERQLAIGPQGAFGHSQFGQVAPWMQPDPWMQPGSMPQGGGLLYPWGGASPAGAAMPSSGGLLQNMPFGSGNGWFA